MKPVLLRRSLADAAEEALREALAEGRFGDSLPGEPALAGLLGVSRVTLRSALSRLTEEGVIAPHRGRRTVILAKPKPAKSSAKEARPRRILFLSANALHELPPGVLLVLDLLRERMERDGLKLEHRRCHAFTLAAGGKALEKLVLSEPAEAYLLHLAPSRAQAWFAARGLPAVVVGTPAEDSRLPGVHTDLHATARHAMRHLRAAGHDARRVGLLVPNIDLPDNLAVVAGFLEAGGESSMILRHPGEAGALRAWIARRNPFGAARPTAVVAAWPGAALALIGRLAVRGGEPVPETLSVVCLYDDPAFGMLVPSVTRYRRPPEKYVAILARLVRRILKGDKPGPAASRTLFPALIRGETVAAPAK